MAAAAAFLLVAFAGGFFYWQSYQRQQTVELTGPSELSDKWSLLFDLARQFAVSRAFPLEPIL